LLNYTLEVSKPGKFPNGKTEIPFEVPLKPKPNKQLYETYHGVFVNIQVGNTYRASDKVHIYISIMPISSPNPMFDDLLESSHRNDSNKWSNMKFGEEITQVVSIEVYFTHPILSSATDKQCRS